MFHAKTRQELPPLFRKSEILKGLRPMNFNNQLQTFTTANSLGRYNVSSLKVFEAWLEEKVTIG